MKTSNILDGIIKSVFLSALAGSSLLLSSCRTPYVDVSVGNPKVYNDGQTRMLLDQLCKDVRNNAPNVTETMLQSISRIQQEYNRLLTARANTIGAPSSPGAENRMQYSPMTAPADSETSPGFTSVLRERIRRQQDISRHELLYIGDRSFFDKNKSLYLIRLDVALLLADTSVSRKYQVLVFTLSGNDDAVGDKVRVYSLAPDYATTVSEDSLITLGMKTLNGMLSGKVKGVDLSVERSMGKQLEQYFVSTNESPVQFAIPCNGKLPCFAFGFGPRRHIVKRGWYNPMSWFGDTYVVEYEYQPTTADCYALLVVDPPQKDMDLKLTVRAFQDLAGFKKGFAWNADAVVIGNFTISLDAAPKSAAQPQQTSKCFPVFPESINPAVASTIIVRTGSPVNPSSVVTVGGVEIPPANLSVLGRNTLKIVIPAKSLQQGENVKGVVATPGIPEVETFCVKTGPKTSNEKKPDPVFTLLPVEGRAGETATIISNDKVNFPLTEVDTVWFGENKVTGDRFSYQDAGKIVFNIPAPGTDISASVGVVLRPKFTKPYCLEFKYKVPLTGKGAKTK